MFLTVPNVNMCFNIALLCNVHGYAIVVHCALCMDRQSQPHAKSAVLLPWSAVMAASGAVVPWQPLVTSCVEPNGFVARPHRSAGTSTVQPRLASQPWARRPPSQPTTLMLGQPTMVVATQAHTGTACTRAACRVCLGQTHLVGGSSGRPSCLIPPAPLRCQKSRRPHVRWASR